MSTLFLATVAATRPKEAILELTYDCNQRCPFCYCVWHARPKLRHRELETHEWQRLIEALVANGTDTITFSGGEPLLRRDLPSLIAYARSLSRALNLRLFTNGSLATEATLDLLKEFRVGYCTSFLRTYDQQSMSGVDFSFEDSIAKLKSARERGLRTFGSLPISTLNLENAVELCQAVLDAGADSVAVATVMPEGRAASSPELLLSDEQYDALKEKIETLAKKYKRRKLTFITERECVCSTAENDFKFVRKNECPAGKRFITISPGGYARQCLHSKRDEFYWEDLAALRGL